MWNLKSEGLQFLFLFLATETFLDVFLIIVIKVIVHQLRMPIPYLFDVSVRKVHSDISR